LIFFWLESVELAKDRVRKRVSEGGHHIEEEVIKRRYKLGIKNLFKLYADKLDSLLIFDNSTLESDLIAEKTLNGEFMVYQLEKFKKLKIIADEG
jgi:predicted ABC-type ATPase